MSGLVLLDEEQQRTLYTNSQPAAAPRYHVEPSQFFRAGASAARSDFTTSTAVPRTADYTRDTGLPRTDFTTNRASGHSGHGKPSGSTHRSSLTAPMTLDYAPGQSGHRTDMEAAHSDSYPMLRADGSPASSTGSSSELRPSVHQYAGTSSGLKISVSWIMTGLIFGLLSGLLLSEAKVSTTAAQWISLPGDLFLRSLKCLVVPYVFCSVAVAVGDIVFVGKVSVIGLQTAKIFLLFWVATAAMGVCVAMVFRPLFSPNAEEAKKIANRMSFTCANRQLLTTMANGTIACATNATSLATETTFHVVDKNEYFAKKVADIATLSLSDQLMQMITPIVSKNIIASLASGDVLSIITFSMLLGTIAGNNYFTKSRPTNYVYLSLLQLRNTFFLLMEWTIWLSPFAVVSIVAGSFASNKNFLATFGDIYAYIFAAITAGLTQVLVVYPLIVFLLTRTNPYSHMKHMLRAYMFAFACASSLATMPVTLTCVKRAKMCSQSVANFVVSIGVASNISGMGFYLPIAIVFIAESSGNGDQITVLRLFGLFVLSILACAGTPPIPASGLVVISTAYTTLFGEMSASAFAYVAAMDFFFDRITTTCNVNDDVMALKIISETTDETVAQDQLGERF